MSLTRATTTAQEMLFCDMLGLRLTTSIGVSRRPLAPNRRAQHLQVRRQSVQSQLRARSLVFQQHGEPTDVLSLHTHHIEPARGGMLTLRILAAPIHPADINTVQGSYPLKPKFTTELATAEPVAVPGKEGVAEVVDVGEDAAVYGWKKGDWAIVRATDVGMWQTHVQAPAGKFLRIVPEGATVQQVASLAVNPCTAWALLKGWIGDGKKQVAIDERVHPGDIFAQNGANSAVGRAAIQLGKKWGLKSVNIIRERPGGAEETEALKRELRDLGADWVFTSTEAEERGFAQRIRKEILGGRREQGIKLGLNCVGGQSSLALANMLDDGAWHVTYGAMAKQPVTIPATLSIFRHQRFTGFFRSRWSKMQPGEYKDAVQELLKMMKAGTFQDTPTQVTRWNWETPEEVLKSAIDGTLGGFRAKKGMFIFEPSQ